MGGERQRRRGPYAKSAATRQTILDAARDSFVHHGYDAATLRDVAERAGITHAGVLHHFESKQALLVALLARRDADEQQRAGLADDNTETSSGTPRDLLAQMLREHQKTPELMRLWAELAPAASRPDHPAHEYFVQRYRRARQVFSQRLGAGAAGGTLDNRVDPDSAAALFVAVLDGLQTQWLLDESVDIVHALTLFRVLLTGAPGPTP